MNRDKLREPSTYLRGTVARGLVSDGEVIRDGGDNGAGLIRGVAIVSRGEALGHEMWLDQAFIEETAAAMRAKAAGAKVRFQHPDVSGDGLGSLLGRAKAARIVGDRVIADLHFAKSSRETPDGDLAKYVMDLATEDPDFLGASIVFKRDLEAEEAFTSSHLNRRGIFASPDSDNSENVPHARLAELRGADIVDEPAANPAGMFHRSSGRMMQDADALLDYALGHGDKEPVMAELSFSPVRVKEWLTRWLSRKGLEIVPAQPATDTASPPTTNPLADGSRDPAKLLAWCQEQRAREQMRKIEEMADRHEAEKQGRIRERHDRAIYS